MYFQKKQKNEERRSWATRHDIDVCLGKLRNVSEFSADHSIRVARKCDIFTNFAQGYLKISESEKREIFKAALCHDLGKTKIGKIVNQGSLLDKSERRQINRHPLLSAEIGKRIQLSNYALAGILHHHERWDGLGYPNKLSGNKIPLSARIIAIADSFDAMVYSRPYHEGTSITDALAEIKRCQEKQFDPLIVEIFTSIPQNLFAGVSHLWH